MVGAKGADSDGVSEPKCKQELVLSTEVSNDWSLGVLMGSVSP